MSEQKPSLDDLKRLYAERYDQAHVALLEMRKPANHFYAAADEITARHDRAMALDFSAGVLLGALAKEMGAEAAYEYRDVLYRAREARQA